MNQFTTETLRRSKGVWHLVDSPVDYKYSSALYYITGEEGLYPVTNYMELADIDLTKKGMNSAAESCQHFIESFVLILLFALNESVHNRDSAEK